MSQQTKSLHRPGMGDYEWVDYSLSDTPAGQWDTLEGRVEGYWASPAAARAAMIGKKVSLPEQPTGYGYYIRAGSLRTGWAANGRVFAEFQATGLYERKMKVLPVSEGQSYSLSNVPVSGLPGLSSDTYSKFQFRSFTVGYDITMCWNVTAQYKVDLATAGRRVTSHWVAAAAGISLSTAPGSNPFTGSDPNGFTWHWPCDWYYEVSPVDSAGPAASGLAIALFRFRHQWDKTL